MKKKKLEFKEILRFSRRYILFCICFMFVGLTSTILGGLALVFFDYNFIAGLPMAIPALTIFFYIEALRYGGFNV